MSNLKFSQLSILVVDDFSSFRSTLVGMLNRLGVKRIEEATRSQEVIKWCQEREFDIILCDYNLGSGRNGQHILEELRFKNLIHRRNLFLMVTAEASKEMVLSAYDCEPDDYLMKPLNLKVLEQRMTRLVHQRDALLPAYRLLDGGKPEAAIAALEAIVREPGRHAIVAQKLLGQLYLESERWDDAEKLYRSNMENRQLDWAQLGVAKVALARGQLPQARTCLEALVKNSRLFLPAHDSLAAVYEQQRDFDGMLACIQSAVQLSPRSLFRQRKLAQVAMEQGEIKHAVDASLEAMKLGELSCHRSPKDALLFLSVAGNALEAGVDCGHIDLADEAKKCFNRLSSDQSLADAEHIQAQLMTARVYALKGNEQKAIQLAEGGLTQLEESGQTDLDVGLAQYAYLVSVDELPAANALADKIIAEHGEDDIHPDKLDKLLVDPQNERNRQRVAELNKTGIEFYSAGAHDEALAYFRRATLLFPRHVGLQLNYLQTLIGQLKQDPDAKLDSKVQSQIGKLKLLIADKKHPQYIRFQQLVANVSAPSERREA